MRDKPDTLELILRDELRPKDIRVSLEQKDAWRLRSKSR